MKILTILSHPNLENSRVNKALKQAVENENIVFNNLYEKYKDFNIDVKAEQELLLQYEKIIFQFPIYWYSCPPLLKKYFDDVFAYGFAYGSKTKALSKKDFAFCISFGDAKESFLENGKIAFSVDEILTPFKALCKFTDANYKGYFAVFKATHGLDNKELNNNCEDYKVFINNFIK